ncbi:MAG: type I restriction-modification system subunit M [Actinomycetota bacterium]
MNHSQIVSFIWGVADLIRDSFRRGKYQDVILPLTVLRRLDCVLSSTKEKVLATNAKMQAKGLENPDQLLRKASRHAFYNTSRYDFDKLLADAPNLKSNLLNYISGFSPNMQEVLDRFDFSNTIQKLDEAGLLFKVVERFKGVDLHPELVDNATMGTIFEELIRKFNEALNENPGEHFTPRDVVHLMVELLLAGDEERLSNPDLVVKICDPCSGSGGMLTIAKDQIEASDGKHAQVHLFGQEVNPETYAICKSDLFMKSTDGRDGENIVFGSTLATDRHAGRRFEYLIANPPYGKDWKGDQEDVRTEHDKGEAGRFPAGLPRISDGQLLFLQHMLSRMAAPEEGGGRVAIIMNGSPLFTGDAGSGESEIRRWVIENDWLEAIIALPEQLFYNTGIATYVWVMTNRKAPERKGKVQLIDATTFWSPMRRSLGDKRRQVPKEKASEIVDLYQTLDERDHTRIFDDETFGYRKITVERPLRLNCRASPERIARLDDQKAFTNLAVSRKKDDKVKAAEEEAGRKRQDELRMFLGSLPDTLYLDRTEFTTLLDERIVEAKLKLPAPLKKAVLAALSERDENAEICRDKDGNPEPDPTLRDYENVPLGEGVRDFFEREVKPYVEDAWINEAVRDPKDGEIGKVGYEINFNRYFYVYEPPRPLEEIKADIKALEKEILNLLGEVAS